MSKIIICFFANVLSPGAGKILYLLKFLLIFCSATPESGRKQNAAPFRRLCAILHIVMQIRQKSGIHKMFIRPIRLTILNSAKTFFIIAHSFYFINHPIPAYSTRSFFERKFFPCEFLSLTSFPLSCYNKNNAKIRKFCPRKLNSKSGGSVMQYDQY